MIIRYHDGSTWKKFTEAELATIAHQKATHALTMLSSFAPVVIEIKGRYIAGSKMRKELDGPCASFEAVIKKCTPDMLFKELMQ